MTERGPDGPRSRWPARDWSWTKVLLLILALAAFLAMLTWDRGHFPGERPKVTEQQAPK
jgi:hypothetical protein